LAAGVGFTEHFLYISEDDSGNPREDVPLAVTNFRDDFGNRYADWTAEFRWSLNNQIGSFYATEGQRHRVSLSVTLPGSDLNYYRVQYRGETVIPLGQSDDYAVRLMAQAGYGSGYGEVGRLPFYQNFFAGGPTSVRGFEDRSLSPFAVGQNGTTLTDQPFGGDAMVSVGTELLIPMPFVQDQSVFRTALFVDAGTAFDAASGLEWDDVSSAYGVDIVWRPVPILPLRFIVSRPLIDRSNNQAQNFRFTVWSQF
jgi:outer membrane protein insertion porin family